MREVPSPPAAGDVAMGWRQVGVSRPEPAHRHRKDLDVGQVDRIAFRRPDHAVDLVAAHGQTEVEGPAPVSAPHRPQGGHGPDALHGRQPHSCVNAHNGELEPDTTQPAEPQPLSDRLG